jgi:hypothetical protein
MFTKSVVVSLTISSRTTLLRSSMAVNDLLQSQRRGRESLKRSRQNLLDHLGLVRRDHGVFEPGSARIVIKVMARINVEIHGSQHGLRNGVDRRGFL